MPDGSSHELRLDDQVYLFPVTAFTGTFHAVDGSRMRFESNAGTASVLSLPDGSRYLFGPYNIFWPWQSDDEWILCASAMRRSSETLEEDTCGARLVKSLLH